jgi:hypothetical protein
MLKSVERPLGLQKVETLIISRKPAHEGGKVVSSTPWPPLPTDVLTGTGYQSYIHTHLHGKINGKVTRLNSET